MHRSALDFLCRALAAAIALACAPVSAVTITVTSGGDDASTAPCTLRNAITAINYGNAVLYAGCRASLVGLFGDNDTVVFAPALAGSTVTLTQGQIANYAPLTIAGSGQTLDAANAARVLYTIAFLRLSALTLTHGDSGSTPGGGLYAKQATVQLDHVTIAANHSGTSGGGLAVVNGNATLTDSHVERNAAGGQGGGLFASAGNVAALRSSVSDNTSQCSGACGGGIVAINSSSVSLTQSTLARNRADTSGSAAAGAVFATDSHLIAINATFAQNGASGADAIAGAMFERHAAGNANAGATFTNVTIAGNTAAAGDAAANVSGGFVLGVGASARATLANTILAGNSAMRGGAVAGTPDLALASGSFAPTSSLLGAALQPIYVANANVFADDPRLGPLGDYGGTNETRLPLGGSAAIDAGTTALAIDAAAQPLTTDQRGFARIIGASVDIGAVEWPGDRIFNDAFGG